MIKLPADLLIHGIRPVGSGQTGRLRGVRGGRERVRAHVRDGGGLPGGSSGGCRSGSARLTSGAPVGEPAANLFCDVELAAPERPGTRDRIPWAAVSRSLRLEQAQRPLGAVRRPRGDDPAVGFAQGLR